MSKLIATDVKVEVDGVDLSEWAVSVEMPEEADKVDLTGFSNSGRRTYGQGLKDGTISITFIQDFAATKVYATLAPLFDSGEEFDLIIRPDASAAISTTNPQFTCPVKLFSFSKINAAIGDRSEVPAEFQLTDDIVTAVS